jgi:hypothetical protein
MHDPVHGPVGDFRRPLEPVERHGGDVRAKLRLAGALTFSSQLLPIDLAIRDWSRRDQAVAERLLRVDNRRMDNVRLLLRDLPRPGRGRGPERACLLTRDRPPLHGRRSPRSQPRGRAGTRRQVAYGVVAQASLLDPQ